MKKKREKPEILKRVHYFQIYNYENNYEGILWITVHQQIRKPRKSGKILRNTQKLTQEEI